MAFLLVSIFNPNLKEIKSDISKVFESVEMLRYYQTIKGFDKLDFYEVISIEHKLSKI